MAGQAERVGVEFTEMELRVAKAICEAAGAVWEDPDSGNGQTAAEFYGQYIEEARAAIRAMREPTNEMLDAPEIVMDEPWNILIGWQAMIDAASPSAKPAAPIQDGTAP